MKKFNSFLRSINELSLAILAFSVFAYYPLIIEWLFNVPIGSFSMDRFQLVFLAMAEGFLFIASVSLAIRITMPSLWKWFYGGRFEKMFDNPPTDDFVNYQATEDTKKWQLRALYSLTVFLSYLAVLLFCLYTASR